MDDVENDETTAPARAQCARAWKELQELRLRIQGKGPPAPVKSEDNRKPRQSRAVPIEPEHVTPVVVPKSTHLRLREKVASPVSLKESLVRADPSRQGGAGERGRLGAQ